MALALAVQAISLRQNAAVTLTTPQTVTPNLQFSSRVEDLGLLLTDLLSWSHLRAAQRLTCHGQETIAAPPYKTGDCEGSCLYHCCSANQAL
jgi:hypothetical protein